MPIFNENLDALRRVIVKALFADDALFDRLVLKGGNALRLVYQVQQRASLDLDLSLDGDLEDAAGTGIRLFALLRDRLDSAGYEFFDERFEPRPAVADGQWGGYELLFKIIAKKDRARIGDDLDGRRRNAVAIDPQHHRTWKIQISKFEYCASKVPYEMDFQTIYVSTPTTIAIEKLRAICQQMPSYRPRRAKTRRARDFYDIHAITTQLAVRLEAPENAEIARAIFQAKDVPLSLLREVRGQRDFHAPDWPSVEQATTGKLPSFDYYLDYVATLAERLEPLWAEEPPALAVGSLR